MNKLKKTDETTAETEMSIDKGSYQQEPEKTASTDQEETKTVPVKEYSEVLFSRTAQKQSSSAVIEQRKQLRRTSWENASTIEHHVDAMGKQTSQDSHSGTSSETVVDKKVDQILAKKKPEP